MKLLTSMKHMISYDIRYSFRKNRMKWVLAAIIQWFLCVRSFGEVGKSFELLSELWPVMGGAKEYMLSNDSSFALPAYWFLFHLYLFILIGFYPISELNFGNGQALIRTYGRKNWLISKLISVAVNITLYYGFYVFLLSLDNLLHGGEIIPQNGIIGLVGIPIFDKNSIELFVVFLLLPWLVSITLSSIQVILSLLINPVLSLLIVVGYIITSVFLANPLLLGNYAMLYRQEWISGKTSLSVTCGIMLCLGILIISITAGIVMFQRKDILPTE